MKNVIMVALGGSIGAVLRYLTLLSTQFLKQKTAIPLGTLMVNVLGCLLIGFLSTLGTNSRWISPEARNFMIVGILGAYTTFSTFGYESVSLFEAGFKWQFAANIALQLLLGFAAVWAGSALGRVLLAKNS